MSVSYQIPVESHFLTTTNIFTAPFNNNPGNPGKYDFTYETGNKGQFVYLLQPDKVLLIERMSVGGDVSEASYFESIDILPQMRLRKSKTGENIYIQPFPIVGYMDNRDIVAWVDSTKSGDLRKLGGVGQSVLVAAPVAGTKDELLMDFEGVLNQIAATVGKVEINININLSIYVISSTLFYQRFKDISSKQTGIQVSGGL